MNAWKRERRVARGLLLDYDMAVAGANETVIRQGTCHGHFQAWKGPSLVVKHSSSAHMPYEKGAEAMRIYLCNDLRKRCLWVPVRK